MKSIPQEYCITHRKNRRQWLLTVKYFDIQSHTIKQNSSNIQKTFLVNYCFILLHFLWHQHRKYLRGNAWRDHILPAFIQKSERTIILWLNTTSIAVEQSNVYKTLLAWLTASENRSKLDELRKSQELQWRDVVR